MLKTATNMAIMKAPAKACAAARCRVTMVGGVNSPYPRVVKVTTL